MSGVPVISPVMHNGFPGLVTEFTIGSVSGNVNLVALWDGSTYYDGTQSNSESEITPVVGDGTSYVGPFTLQEVFEIYWRIKTFKITGFPSASASSTVDTFTASASIAGGTYTEATSILNNETDLLKGLVGYGTCSQVGNDQEPPPSDYYYGAFANAGASFTLSNSFPALIRHIQGSDDYYVSMDAQINSSAWGAPGGDSYGVRNAYISVSLSKPNPDLGGGSIVPCDLPATEYHPSVTMSLATALFSITLTGGRVVTQNMYGFHAVDDVHTHMTFTNSLSGTLAVEIDKYWPYANSAGAAIWDTATGEKLVNPSS